jgi:succinyl-diaminopimelate desuccinylase
VQNPLEIGREIDSQLDRWIDSHTDEIVSAVQKLIAIPSVKGEPVHGAPYGKETREALDNVLDIAKRYGFGTKMLDGYAAHADFGAGEELIGVLSHVDVVPAGSDWKHNPWGAEIEDGKIYGRGAIDDKGPTIAGLYALIAIKELGVPVKRRLRHILGADEESGFGCMHHYFDVAKKEMPTAGFTPDGRFPAIYAEKGIATPTLTSPVPSQTGDIKLISMAAGQRSNMVPDRAQAQISGESGALKSIASKIDDTACLTASVDGNILKVEAVGVGAHASLPHEGINAVGLLCDALLKIDELNGYFVLLRALHSFAADNTGACLGIAGRDEPSGELTSNLGVLETKKGALYASFSIRYPVTWLEADVKSRIESSANKIGFTLSEWHHSNPLHVPKDSPFLTTLLSVYRSETGDIQEPQSMGGGTYARVLKNGVAFGPNFPGFPDNAHQADEYWTVADLIKATKIYAKALVRLAQ